MHTSMSHTTIVRRACSAALLLASSLALGACGSDGSAPKLAPLDLSPGGLNATIDAPQGATVAKDKFLPGVIITAESPKGYAVSVYEIAADLAQDKSDCTGARQKNCTVVAEQSDAIVTKWKQFGRDNFKVVVALGPKLVCQTTTLEARIESRAVADSILASCRTFKTK